ncbi:MAG: DUF3108 domain-containing protein [Muribaculaceae bacterium]|nr:DUF3108 domain-containing protein [Muribaculaceae bacterium]
MKRILCIFAVLMGLVTSVSAQQDVYHYKIKYKFGIINKTAAHACVHINTQGDLFTATMDGNSISWGGRVYCVQDTLVARMSHQPGPAAVREQVVYQNGWYSKPRTSEYLDGTFSMSDPASYRNTAGAGQLDASSSTMEAIKITTDMLGLFYSFRYLPLADMTNGATVVLPVTGASGANQNVSITYNGVEDCSVDGADFSVYNCTFEYYYQGRPSGYRVRCLVECESRVPLLFSTDLPIGHVEMICQI